MIKYPYARVEAAGYWIIGHKSDIIFSCGQVPITVLSEAWSCTIDLFAHL
jgi:hypothetical protein